MSRTVLAFLLLLTIAITVTPASAQKLFVGLEVADLATRTSTLANFPNVTWTPGFVFEVSGAAATPEGTLYLCNGPFTTHLYTSTLAGPPELACTISVDISGLGYGNGKLYGFSNYASPMGIYEINTHTGLATLRLDTSSQGFRFFALDFNTTDGLLYGYTEYGVSGLYSINIETGVMTRIVGSPPNVNGQGRGLAVGNNTVYLTCTRGDEGEGCFAYNLAQGPNGAWTSFTNAFTHDHATGGATWIPASPTSGAEPGTPASAPLADGILRVTPNPFTGSTTATFAMPAGGLGGLEVFDLAGRLVATRRTGLAEAGLARVSWDGRDDAGMSVAPGVYFLRPQGGSDQPASRVILVR
jgi:hypothetical protein